MPATLSAIENAFRLLQRPRPLDFDRAYELTRAFRKADVDGFVRWFSFTFSPEHAADFDAKVRGPQRMLMQWEASWRQRGYQRGTTYEDLERIAESYPEEAAFIDSMKNQDADIALQVAEAIAYLQQLRHMLEEKMKEMKTGGAGDVNPDAAAGDVPRQYALSKSATRFWGILLKTTRPLTYDILELPPYSMGRATVKKVSTELDQHDLIDRPPGGGMWPAERYRRHTG